MKVSAWCIVKNEAQFIGYGLMSILPYVDEVVYFDGNSTDGTLKLLDYIKGKYDTENKIKVFLDKDFKDFKDDYVKTCNDCMKACTGDYLWFMHPDMILVDPGRLAERKNWASKAYWVNLRSFAGEDMEFEIAKGRTDKWKTIMKNGLGLHYWGNYGHAHEDMYFGHITGREHIVHHNMRLYPFRVENSEVKLWHMCECKPRKRREEKMGNVLRTVYDLNDEGHIKEVMINHPRVHLQSQDSAYGNFKFVPRKDPLPEVFSKYKEEFEKVLND